MDLGPVARVFPLALQIGFVFVGGQAGRVLNVRELKELFPRIVSGFVIGFFIGGLAGFPLLALREEPQDLLFGAAAAQLAFVGLLIVTDRRFPRVRSAGRPDTADTDEPVRPRVSLRDCARQPADHRDLRLPGALGGGEPVRRLPHVRPGRPPLSRCGRPDALGDLFTAVVNLVDIRRARVLAGYLLKRFGLRFGLIANPAAVGLVFVAWRSRGQSRHSDGRIPDAVRGHSDHRHRAHRRHHTDVDQCDLSVIPVDERLAVQTAIESRGVPAAIGLAGVILLVLQGVARGDNGVVAVATVVAIAWTAVAWMANREYTEGLRQAVVKRTLVESPLDLTDEREAEALRQLLRSDDGRQVALGLDLLAGLTSPAPDAELKRLLDDDEPEVRLGALAELARNERLSTLSPADAAIVIAELDGDRDLNHRSPWV